MFQDFFQGQPILFVVVNAIEPGGSLVTNEPIGAREIHSKCSNYNRTKTNVKFFFFRFCFYLNRAHFNFYDLLPK